MLPLPCEQKLHFRCVISCRAKSSLDLPTTVQICPEIWRNKFKKRVFPVLDHVDRFRALLELCVADQRCRNFFYSREFAPFDDYEWRANFGACTIEN